MATRKLRLEGIAEWARVFEQNREMTGYKPTPQAVGAYEECNGACKIDIIMNDENFKKLKASKSMKSGTDDELGRTDDYKSSVQLTDNFLKQIIHLT